MDKRVALARLPADASERVGISYEWTGYMKVSLGLFAILLAGGALFGEEKSFHLESVGVRGGASKIYAHAPFYQVEAFANWDLPWRWDYEWGGYLQMRLDVT